MVWGEDWVDRDSLGRCFYWLYLLISGSCFINDEETTVFYIPYARREKESHLLMIMCMQCFVNNQLFPLLSYHAIFYCRISTVSMKVQYHRLLIFCSMFLFIEEIHTLCLRIVSLDLIHITDETLKMVWYLIVCQVSI